MKRIKSGSVLQNQGKMDRLQDIKWLKAQGAGHMACRAQRI